MTEAARIFWIQADIVLQHPITVVNPEPGESPGIQGALMEFGVTASSQAAALAKVGEFVARLDQFAGLQHHIEYPYIGEIDRSDVQAEIFADEEVAPALLADPLHAGLWYRTGVGWYSDA